MERSTTICLAEHDKYSYIINIQAPKYHHACVSLSYLPFLVCLWINSVRAWRVFNYAYGVTSYIYLRIYNVCYVGYIDNKIVK